MSEGASLGERAMRRGLDPYRPTDFYYVLDKSSRQPDRLVLVGGQALEVWGTLLNVPPPVAEEKQGNYYHALTVDADWLGCRDDAEWLAELLGVERTQLCIPAPDDPTANTAVLYLERDSRIMLMDFLATVTGLDNDEIKKFAPDVVITSDLGQQFNLRVLDPIHCLQSRMSNLKAYATKREGNGPDQAAWAVDLVRAYLLYLVNNGAPEKTMRSQCHRVAELAEYGAKAAEFCFANYGIDPLQAVTGEVITAAGQQFQEMDWPITTARIRAKQEHWIDKARRLRQRQM